MVLWTTTFLVSTTIMMLNKPRNSAEVLPTSAVYNKGQLLEKLQLLVK